MDLVDRAQAQEQHNLAVAIRLSALLAPPLPPCGQCYNCASPLPPGLRFCDSDCRDDHGQRKAAEARNG